MSYQAFINKIRQWDNQASKWILRHFYMIFFEFVLVVIFFVFLFNTFHSIDLANTPNQNLTEQLLCQQLFNTSMIILLLLLNAFWLLYLFNGMNRIRLLLKDIGFQLLRRRHQDG